MNPPDQVGVALVAALASSGSEPLRLHRPLEALTGGFWATIWSVDFDAAPAPFDRPLVLRVMPEQGAGAREAVVQRVVSEAGFPTPRVIASGSAPGLGESFILMERVAGRPPLGGLRLGPEIVGLPKLLRSLPTALADAAHRLHRIDPVLLLDALVQGSLPLRSGAERFRSSLDTVAAECPSSGFGAVASWFDDHAPAPGPDVICHGDLHPFNLLCDDVGETWVLDWTTASIAPREMDIGFTAGLLRSAPIAVPRGLGRVIARITNHLAESFIASSAQRAPVDHAGLDGAGLDHAGLDRAAVDWWEALQHARCLADLTQGRLHPGGVVGPEHPFETSAASMQGHLRALTGLSVTLPARVGS